MNGNPERIRRSREGSSGKDGRSFRAVLQRRLEGKAAEGFPPAGSCAGTDALMTGVFWRLAGEWIDSSLAHRHASQDGKDHEHDAAHRYGEGRQDAVLVHSVRAPCIPPGWRAVKPLPSAASMIKNDRPSNPEGGSGAWPEAVP